MPDTTLGNLLISSDGETASLTQNGLPATALLIVTLANFFIGEDRQNSHPNVKLLNKNVAQIDYDYKDEKEAIQLTIHWDQKSDPHLDFYTFHWKKPPNLHILQDGISLTTNPHQFWYGGVNLMDLRWPIAPSSEYELSLFGTNDVHLGDSIKLGDQSTFWYGGFQFHSMDLEWPMAKKNSEMSEFILNDIYHDSMKLGDENDQTHWYGGSNLMNLEWPMRKNSYKMSEFVLNDIYQFTGTSGQERYWLSSKKVAINVPWNVPLWTAVQGRQLELQSRLVDSQFLLMNDHLEYTLAVAKNENMTLKDFHQQCFRKFLKAPTAYPDLAIMEKPIWSTWASFWTGVNRTQVEEYAEQIKANGMPISQLELDDMWTTTYGDYQINPEKFPDFKGMVKKLKENYGVPRMTAWVHPFVNADSENGKNEELRNKIFIKDKNGDVPLSWWWDCPPKAKDPTKPIDDNNPDLKVPCAYVIDLTNPDARDWWFGELKRMQDEGIYTFKFDAGETNWFPKNYTLHSGNNPNNFGQDYAYFSAQFGPAVENRYGSGSQQANIFMRTMDRNSYWDKEGGLFTLIPWALQSSLHGYFWNLPDMIGGNGLNHTHENIKGDPPEAQLYIRWTQANAFLLAMQFSYPPWHPNYSPEVLKTVKKVMDLRAKWMPYILKCVKNAVKDQEPVIRPMWWESDAQDALASRDQYMVGKDMVVAPVVEKDKYERNVYLPPGTWKDGNKENVEYAGDKTYSYQAPIDIVPFFVRVGTSPNAAFPSMAASILASILPLLVASIILLNFNGN